MLKRWYVVLAIALVASLVVQDALAQRARRNGTQRFGGRLGQRFNNQGQNAPGQNGLNQNGAAQAGNRPDFGQRLGNLASKLQGAANSGALNNLFKDLGDFAGASGLATQPGQLKTNFTAENRPFTASWYASHPNAWRYTHPHADAWAVASIGTAAAWLGIEAATDGSYYTSDTEDETTDPIEDDAQYLSFGVFGIAAPGSQDASALIQLAVDRQGVLYGNYYDVLTGKESPITGKVDKQTELATFKVEGNESVEFEVSLVSLTQPTGTLTLRTADGKTRQASLSRLEDPSAQAN
jgi:hypothetical protein